MRTLPLALLLASLALGCRKGDTADTATDTAVEHADRDNDGYADDVDCDDFDASIHPGQDEVCDEIDNDCDGFVDSDDADLLGGDIWYVDADIDGYGDEDSAINACEQPEDHIAQGGDCDDGDATINPDKREECDGIDNDCDGEVDEDGALWSESWYADDDEDGFGDPDTVREACEQPEGWVQDNDDCDDDDDDTYPGAPEARDGEDQDCDGFVDEVGPDEAWAILEGESGGDRAGRAVAGAGDPDGDGLMDLWVGARGDDDAGGDGGAAYLVTGDDAGQRSLGNAAAKLTGLPGSWAGHALDGGRDLDGDGSADLVVGAPYDDQGERNAGCAWLVRGPHADGSLGERGIALMGMEDSDYAGWSVALLGDVDGDGVGDVLVGVPYGKDGASTPGAAYVVDGGTAVDLSLADAGWVLMGEDTQDGAGAKVASGGDLDGDGLADLLVGANGTDDAGSAAGTAYVVMGASLGGGGTLDLAQADASIHGEGAGDYAGYGLAGGGDVDGDGHDDLLVGAPYEDEGDTNAGAAYLLLGPVDGVGSVTEATGKMVGFFEGHGVGHAVAIVEDIDGDALPDILVGGPVYLEDEEPGLTGLWIDAVEGTVGLTDADRLFQGAHDGDYLGYALAGPGDMDGDGLGDLVLGASLDDGAGNEAGATYLVFGVL